MIAGICGATRRAWPSDPPAPARSLQLTRSMVRPSLPVSELQLATLVEEPPEGPDWLHEQKFDGYRMLADKRGSAVKLLSRRFKDWTPQFTPIADAIAKLPYERIVMDGEVCVLLPDGRTSFQALQNALSGQRAALVYFAFDLLIVDDERVMGLPLEQRKARLKKLLPKSGPLRFSDHVAGSGTKFLRLACEQGLEGIISKRKDRPYVPGRGMTWVKTKCLLRQELVIGGFTEPEGSRSGFGSLLLGYYETGKLRYAGKVGTGFSMKVLKQLHAALAPTEIDTCPFDPTPERAWTGPRRHWVEPKLVAEVAFSEWTADGRLRHPSFQGLRADKRPKDVVRERAAVSPD
jgi:bifunctional non-homologous end joining protein LigD